MVVEVTAEHIANGKRKAPGCCPIALAIQAKLPKNRTAQVLLTTIFINSFEYSLVGRQIASFRTHPELQKFIRNFDDGLSVEPFAFELPDQFCAMEFS